LPTPLHPSSLSLRTKRMHIYPPVEHGATSTDCSKTAKYGIITILFGTPT